MSRKLVIVAAFCLILAALASWNTSYYQTPKLITADGDDLLACRGIMTVTSEGSPPTYSIAYTNESGVRVQMYGIHKLTIFDTRGVGDPARCGQ
jgi:hypothetical protein